MGLSSHVEATMSDHLPHIVATTIKICKSYLKKSKNGKATVQSTRRAKLCTTPPLAPVMHRHCSQHVSGAHGRGLLSALQDQAARLWVWDEYYVGRGRTGGDW